MPWLAEKATLMPDWLVRQYRCLIGWGGNTNAWLAEEAILIPNDAIQNILNRWRSYNVIGSPDDPNTAASGTDYPISCLPSNDTPGPPTDTLTENQKHYDQLMSQSVQSQASSRTSNGLCINPHKLTASWEQANQPLVRQLILELLTSWARRNDPWV